LMGSKEGIMHISMAFLNPGDRVLVPNPGYPTYTSITRLVGAEVLPYPLRAENHWLPDLEALESQGLEGVKLMWVNYPHMPTGALAPDAFFEKLIAFARRNQILLCSDNPYSLVLNPAPQSLLGYEGAKEVAIELNSLSKSHNMAGWRVGMVGGAKEYIDPILQIKSNMDSGMFLPMQEAAVKALSNSYAWHQSRNDEYRERRKIAWQLLDKLGCMYESNQSGMFVWARIPDTESNGEALSEKLLNQRSVFITPGFIFGDEGEKYIRISLCAPLHRMQEALDRVETLQQIPQP
ncbi:MAG: aminotransferase class I/II-fold pyridoxal phosphate-dependent enzyme, partial [Bacteroidetes bacterium]